MCVVEVELTLEHCHSLAQQLVQVKDRAQLVGDEGCRRELFGKALLIGTAGFDLLQKLIVLVEEGYLLGHGLKHGHGFLGEASGNTVLDVQGADDSAFHFQRNHELGLRVGEQFVGQPAGFLERIGYQHRFTAVDRAGHQGFPLKRNVVLSLEQDTTSITG